LFEAGSPEVAHSLTATPPPARTLAVADALRSRRQLHPSPNRRSAWDRDRRGRRPPWAVLARPPVAGPPAGAAPPPRPRRAAPVASIPSRACLPAMGRKEPWGNLQWPGLWPLGASDTIL